MIKSALQTMYGGNASRKRILSCLKEVDPSGVAIRTSQLIIRVKYDGVHSNFVWHHDSNHKVDITSLIQTMTNTQR